jgi:chromosome segregation ATPase
MLRRLKDELQKAKAENQALKEQLDNRSGSADSQRRINGRGTPLSEDGHESALRSQIVDGQRQVQRLTSENQDLHRRLDLSQMDVDRVRRELESLQREAEDRLHRIDDLEDELAELQGTLQVARGGGDASLAEHLQRENMALKHENEQLSHKIELLLEVDHPPSSNYGDGTASLNRPTSNLSSDMEHQFDDWNPRLASNRPLSHDYGQ